MNRPPIYFVVPVWGDAYVDVFLDVTLPALLSPNNIPGTTDRSVDRFDIYSTQEDYGRIVSSPLFAKLEQHIHASVHVTDAPRSSRDSNWGDRYTKKSECYRSAIQRAAVMDAANFMLNADIVLSDGFVKRAAELLAAGKRVIELPGPRTLKPEMVRDLKARANPDGTIAVPARELVALSMQHLHPLMNMHLWGVGDINQPFHPSHLYWKIGENSLLARCFHLYPIVVHPRDTDAATEFDTTIDDDLVEKACPDPADTHVVTDSDEMFCCELSAADHYVGEMARRGDVPKMVEFYHAYGKSRNWTLLRHEILMVGGSIDELELEKARAQSETLVQRLLKRGGRDGQDAPVQQQLPALAASNKPKMRFLLAVWGEKHSNLFLDFALPSLLAPGNIPAVAKEFDCVFEVLTMRIDIERFRMHPAMRMLSRIMPIRAIQIDDIEVRHSYGIMLTAAFGRGIVAEGADMTNTHFVFLNADFLFSDGSLSAMMAALKRGRNAVLAPSFRCVGEEFIRRMEGQIDPLRPVLSMTGRDLVGQALELMHPTFEAKVVNQDRIFNQLVNQFLWRVDDDTYLGRFFLMFMLCIKPEKPLEKMVGFCDYTFVPELVPSGNFEVLTDSDDIFILELQHRQHESEFFLEDRPTADYLATRISEWSTVLHRSYSAHNLLFHRGSASPQAVETAKREAEAYLADMTSRLGPPQPYHNHQYWSGTFAALQKTPEDFPLMPRAGLRSEMLVFPLQDVVHFKPAAARTLPDDVAPPSSGFAAPLRQSDEIGHSLAAKLRRKLKSGEGSKVARGAARTYLAAHAVIRGVVRAPMRMVGFTLVREADLKSLEDQLLEAREFGETQRQIRNDATVKLDKSRESYAAMRREREMERSHLRSALDAILQQGPENTLVDLEAFPDREVAAWLEKVQALRVSDRRHTEALESQITEIRRLSRQLEQERGQNNSLRVRSSGEIAALQAELAQMAESRDKLNAALAEEVVKRNQALCELGEAQAQAATVEEQRFRVAVELERERAEAARLRAEFEASSRRLVEIDAELHRFRANHNAAAEELEQERARHSEARALLNQALAHQEAAMSQATKWQEAAQSASAELTAALASRGEAENRAHAAERQVIVAQRRAAIGGAALPISWIASYPRSGNTWLRALVCCLEFGADCDLHAMQRMVPDLLDVYDPRWMADRTRLLAKSHFPPEQAERQAAVLEPSAFTQSSVLIVRHPFDVAIACYDMVMLNTPNGAALAEGDTRDRFDAYFDDFVRSGGAKNGILQGEGLGLTEFLAAWVRQIDSHGGLIVNYEAMLADPLESLSRVAKTLGIAADTSQLLAAVQRCSFDRLRADEEADIVARRDTNSEFFRGWREEAYKTGRRFFNVGRSGRWMSVLRPEQVALGAEYLRQAFELSGYRVPE